MKSYRSYLNKGGIGQLVVLNPQEDMSFVQDLIDSRHIVVVRKISDMELAVLYTNAQCSLVLSSYEGFGLPVLESLACETQVICAQNSSLVEAGGSIVDFVDNMSEDNLANKMLNYDKKDKYEILCNVELEHHLKRFSWEECARQYIKFYTTLLELK